MAIKEWLWLMFYVTARLTKERSAVKKIGFGIGDERHDACRCNTGSLCIALPDTSFFSKLSVNLLLFKLSYECI
jgi:hypothetical protein